MRIESLTFSDRSSLSVQEVAKVLRVTSKHIVALIERGEIQGVRTKRAVGRRAYRIPVEAYERFVSGNLNVRVTQLPKEASAAGRFPYPMSDLKGHTIYLVEDVAQALDITPKHVGQLIDDGALIAVNVRSEGASRSCYRIPVESYRAFVLARTVRPRLDPEVASRLH